MLGAVGEPTAGTVSGAIGKPATLGRLGVGTDGEPAADGGRPMIGTEACAEEGDGDGGGDEASPSTWSKMAYSASEPGDATFRFFLDLVINVQSPKCKVIMVFKRLKKL